MNVRIKFLPCCPQFLIKDVSLVDAAARFAGSGITGDFPWGLRHKLYAVARYRGLLERCNSGEPHSQEVF